MSQTRPSCILSFSVVCETPASAAIQHLVIPLLCNHAGAPNVHIISVDDRISSALQNYTLIDLDDTLSPTRALEQHRGRSRDAPAPVIFLPALWSGHLNFHMSISVLRNTISPEVW